MQEDLGTRRDVVAIGGSMGSVAPLRSLLAALPETLSAAIFIVLHRGPSADSKLTETLDPGGLWRARDAVDLEPIERGRIYVAPADHHLLISGDCVRVTRGPRENLARPAIDTLFRSAAAHCGSRTIAIVLSGLLNDGAAGACAVKRAGGVVVVQAPSDALESEMPEHALASTPVDHVVPVADMPQLLVQLTESSAPPDEVPHDIMIEAQVAERVMADLGRADPIGSSSKLGCPGCGGPLWEIGDVPGKRYRCHIGHSYTAQALLQGQEQAIENALWVAYRTLRDRLAMLQQNGMGGGTDTGLSSLQKRIEQTQQHLELLRSLLIGI